MKDYPTMISAYLASRPGSHLRMIQRELGIALGTLRYHLVRMERSGDISSYSLGRLKGYFVAGEVDHALKPYLMALRNEPARAIVRHLLEEGAGTHENIAERLRLPPSTVRIHIRLLMKGGILRREDMEGDVVYSLTSPDLARDGLERVGHPLTCCLAGATAHVTRRRGK